MLQNFYGIIEVKYYQLGRLRLQTDVLKKNTELREEFQNNIKRISGIEKAVVNPINGSILLVFDENIIEHSFLYLVVLKLLHLEEEIFKMKSSKTEVALKKLFEALDLAIYNKSRGFLNVKTVLAGVIAFYGIKKLRKSNAILSGWTLLWWASSLLRGENKS